MSRVDKLASGEVWFVPEIDWRTIKSNSGPLYSQLRDRGLFLHCVKDVQGGTAGMRIWADDKPRQPKAKLFADRVVINESNR
jgi:hypothetical protein